jgi:hypothetical protein
LGVYRWVWQGLRMGRPPPGLRPVRYAYAPPSVEKLLGALPVVAEFCRRLDVAGIVDRACPVREVARVTHGPGCAATPPEATTRPPSPPTIPTPPPLQARLLELLNVDPTRPRWAS